MFAEKVLELEAAWEGETPLATDPALPAAHSGELQAGREPGRTQKSNQSAISQRDQGLPKRRGVQRSSLKRMNLTHKLCRLWSATTGLSHLPKAFVPASRESYSAANSQGPWNPRKQGGFCLRLWSVCQRWNWTLISTLFAVCSFFHRYFLWGHDSHFLSFNLPQVIEPLASRTCGS